MTRIRNTNARTMLEDEIVGTIEYEYFTKFQLPCCTYGFSLINNQDDDALHDSFHAVTTVDSAIQDLLFDLIYIKL